MQELQSYSVIAVACALAACSQEVGVSDGPSTSSFSNVLLSDCVTASNALQQEAKMQEALITDSESRRVDFLLRDEWMRRLSVSEDRSEFYPVTNQSEFGKKMLGNLNNFDYVAASNVQLAQCGELIEALKVRLLNEVSS